MDTPEITPTTTGITGRPALLPRLPGDGGTVVLERDLAADLIRAYFDMGPEERKTRNVGVLRYLMHRYDPGFHLWQDGRLSSLNRELAIRREGPDVEVTLTYAEWRSVHRVLELTHGRESGLESERAREAMRRLFGVDPGFLDIDVTCSRCGRETGSQDARLVDGSWVGEVCCLGRARMIPAEAFPEDAHNFLGDAG